MVGIIWWKNLEVAIVSMKGIIIEFIFFFWYLNRDEAINRINNADFKGIKTFFFFFLIIKINSNNNYFARNKEKQQQKSPESLS